MKQDTRYYASIIDMYYMIFQLRENIDNKNVINHYTNITLYYTNVINT